ncbi:MAG: acyltransferase domain-containing protein [Candidatus Coproplasma sp.]
MKNAYEFCKLLNMDEQTCREIAALVEKVQGMLGDKIKDLAVAALQDGVDNEQFLSLLTTCENCGEEIGEHKFRMQLVFSYYCFALLEEKYQRAGLSKSLYENTIQDFKFRVYECREVYNFTGIFVAWWYLIFCNLSLHKFGGLEFERTVSNFEYNKRGVNVKKGDEIIALHIPPKFKMNRQTVTEALRESYSFYGFKGRVAYQCDSWLLYPDFERVFVQGGNVCEFRTFFDIINKTDNREFEDCWRVFKVGKIENLDDLPTDTRLQKNMLQHLKNGGKTGYGFGVLVFDGKDIL